MIGEKGYAELLDALCSTYGLTAYAEHKYVHELFEGPIPLFKLILAKQNHEKRSMVVLSMHIDLDPTMAIEWYLRVENLCKDVRITACYLRDPSGDTAVGEEAEVLRTYLREQEIIGAWIASEQTEEDFKEISANVNQERPKAFSSSKDALRFFYNMKKNKDDVCH